MRTTRLLSALVAVLLTTSLVAGCGEPPKPKPFPPESSSPSASASPSPTPPVLPDAIHQRSQAGSEAAVRFFIQALNYSGKSGDTAVLRRAFTATCTRCESLADAIDHTYASGGDYKGGDWSNVRLKYYAIRQRIAYIDATVDYEAQQWVKSKGAEPTSFEATKDHLHAFQLSWHGDQGWQVGALDPDS